MRHADTIEQKVKTFMEQHRMISPQDTVVAGVSGGADSVCLLFVLLRWMEEIPFSLHVVHVNHRIREEAGVDAAYVQQLCEKYNLPFTLVEENVRERAVKEKRSEEEMGRLVRYEAFEKVRVRIGAEKIAVAHNSNDQAETMLFHLFRGSGLSGLCGIRPVRDHIIRPILCLERKEIEEYLAEKEISYCRDVTNEEDDYTRNRIRHHILPYAEQEIFKGCVGHMARTAEMLLDTEGLLERLTQEAWEKVVRRPDRREAPYRADRQDSGGGKPAVEGGKPIDEAKASGSSQAFQVACREFNTLDPVIGSRLIYKLLTSLSPGGKDVAYVHVQDVQELFAREGNRYLCLPYGIRAERQYDKVRIGRSASPAEASAASGKSSAEASAVSGKLPAEASAASGKSSAEANAADGQHPQTVTVLTGELTQSVSQIPVQIPGYGPAIMEFQVFLCKNCKDIPQNMYTKWFDYDKIKELLTVRPRQTGDYLTIKGPGETQIHKSVKDYMVTEKIPRQERDQIPLLAEGNHILWVVGHRISEYYKISKNTKRILQVQLRRDCECSETEENNGRTC